ncbi:hypothetical protein ABIE48_005360 [Paenibacillus sp. OAE614]
MSKRIISYRNINEVKEWNYLKLKVDIPRTGTFLLIHSFTLKQRMLALSSNKFEHIVQEETSINFFDH